MSEDGISYDDKILAGLESDLKTVALKAQLDEWTVEHIHKISAFVVILGWWRTRMRNAGYTDTTIDGVLPMVIHRVWPDPNGEKNDDDHFVGDE